MLRLTVTIIALALPSVAAASCYEKHQEAQSCAEGFTWSADTQSCVQQITS